MIALLDQIDEGLECCKFDAVNSAFVDKWLHTTLQASILILKMQKKKQQMQKKQKMQKMQNMQIRQNLVWILGGGQVWTKF